MAFPQRFAALALAFSLTVIAAVGPGCSGKGIDETDPAVLMKDAESDISSDRYTLAADKLRVVKNKFPYSKYAAEAQLRLADVYFLQESFAEAALAYQAFADLHPKHARVAYAFYRVGLSHYNDAPDLAARDQGPMTKAVEAFEVFLQKFPQDPQAGEARDKLRMARERLADKELYVANFYYKRDMWEPAKGRFDKILAQFPQSTAAQEARSKLPRVEKELAAEKAREAKEKAEEEKKGKAK